MFGPKNYLLLLEKDVSATDEAGYVPTSRQWYLLFAATNLGGNCTEVSF